ncbi:hypothetical protein RchiOBHm_Chr7g0225911 [Rosa chinensis]|uniref:Uncharacterized protein n=1 Tax=Rosa chinensis TaxID=74649 RepID=A0A2P6PE83_ROSCH|nr:hypothetical protein RchiOBHm_Chr7g0225911 [Rosa chinensis]
MKICASEVGMASDSDRLKRQEWTLEFCCCCSLGGDSPVEVLASEGCLMSVFCCSWRNTCLVVAHGRVIEPWRRSLLIIEV